MSEYQSISDTKEDKKTSSVSVSNETDTSFEDATYDFSPEVMALKSFQTAADNSPSSNSITQLQATVDESIVNDLNGIVQLQAKADSRTTSLTQPIQKQENNTGLPDNLKSGMENLSGISMDDVKVHRNSDKPAQLQAHAYAQGTDIHLGPGQEKHLPHELGHVVQQKQGRVKPTMQMKGKINVNDDPGLEKEADVIGKKSLSMGKESESIIEKINFQNLNLSDSPGKSKNSLQRKLQENIKENSEVDTIQLLERDELSEMKGNMQGRKDNLEEASKDQGYFGQTNGLFAGGFAFLIRREINKQLAKLNCSKANFGNVQVGSTRSSLPKDFYIESMSFNYNSPDGGNSIIELKKVYIRREANSDTSHETSITSAEISFNDLNFGEIVRKQWADAKKKRQKEEIELLENTIITEHKKKSGGNKELIEKLTNKLEEVKKKEQTPFPLSNISGKISINDIFAYSELPNLPAGLINKIPKAILGGLKELKKLVKSNLEAMFSVGSLNVDDLKVTTIKGENLALDQLSVQGISGITKQNDEEGTESISAADLEIDQINATNYSFNKGENDSVSGGSLAIKNTKIKGENSGDFYKGKKTGEATIGEIEVEDFKGVKGEESITGEKATIKDSKISGEIDGGKKIDGGIKTTKAFLEYLRAAKKSEGKAEIGEIDTKNFKKQKGDKVISGGGTIKNTKITGKASDELNDLDLQVDAKNIAFIANEIQKGGGRLSPKMAKIEYDRLDKILSGKRSLFKRFKNKDGLLKPEEARRMRMCKKIFKEAEILKATIVGLNFETKMSDRNIDTYEGKTNVTDLEKREGNVTDLEKREGKSYTTAESLSINLDEKGNGKIELSNTKISKLKETSKSVMNDIAGNVVVPIKDHVVQADKLKSVDHWKKMASIRGALNGLGELKKLNVNVKDEFQSFVKSNTKKESTQERIKKIEKILIFLNLKDAMSDKPRSKEAEKLFKKEGGKFEMTTMRDTRKKDEMKNYFNHKIAALDAILLSEKDNNYRAESDESSDASAISFHYKANKIGEKEMEEIKLKLDEKIKIVGVIKGFN